MVWIHGGAFIGGSASSVTSNPISLLRHDVIVVSINYRLGIYGFMCLDIPEVPGNQGLKDQIIALRWINENIDAFGGDVGNITLFGESAGGMSVNLHLFSSYEMLFNKVIIESGPALSYWMMVESNNTIPVRLAEELGFKTTDINIALSYLSSVDVHTLINTASDLKIASGMGTDQPLTKPCVEKTFTGVENFITEHPMNINSTKAKSTPIIIGHNNKEFAFQYALQNAEYFATYDLNELFELGFDMSNDLDEAFDTVKHFYIGDEKLRESVKWNLVDLGTDFIFGHPTQRMAEKLLDSGANNVYRYVFSYSGSRNMMNGTGASHGDELAYLFDSNTSGTETTAEDQLVIDRLTKLWTNFAKYG